MRELGSPAAAKRRKTMPKSLKEYSQEVKSLKGISPLHIQFLPEILEGKEKKRRKERRERETDTISKGETRIFLFLSLHLTSRNSSLNVC